MVWEKRGRLLGDGFSSKKLEGRWVGPVLELQDPAYPYVLCPHLAQKPPLASPPELQQEATAAQAQAVPAPGRCSFAFICIMLPGPSGPSCLRPSSPGCFPRPLLATAIPQPNASCRSPSARGREFLRSSANSVWTSESSTPMSSNISTHPLHSATPTFSAPAQSFPLWVFVYAGPSVSNSFPPSAPRELGQGSLQ